MDAVQRGQASAACRTEASAPLVLNLPSRARSFLSEKLGQSSDGTYSRHGSVPKKCTSDILHSFLEAAGLQVDTEK